MEEILFKIIQALHPIWRAIGINPTQLFHILSLKLLLEKRTPKPLLYGEKASKVSPYSHWLVALVQLVLGSMLVLVFTLHVDLFTSVSIFLLLFMSILGTSLVQDFTGILLDAKDYSIINPCPIPDNVILWARILYMFIKLFSQALFLSIPCIGYFIYQFPWQDCGLLLLVLPVAAVTVLFLVILLYVVALRFLSVARFKKLLGTFQLLISALIFALYMFGSHFIAWEFIAELNLKEPHFMWLLPSLWLASIFQVTSEASDVAYLFILGLGFPILLMYLSRGYLAQGFGSKVAEVAGSVVKKANRPSAVGAQFRLSALVCSRKVERAVFILVGRMMARSQALKQQFYPNLVIVPIYFIYIFLTTGVEGYTMAEIAAHVLAKGSYLFPLYMLLLAFITLLKNISLAQDYKASWVFYAAPISSMGEIQAGVIKSIVLRLYLPILLLLGGALVAILGVQLVNDVLLAGALSIILMIVKVYYSPAYIPFSQPAEVLHESFFKNITHLIVIICVGMAHSAIKDNESLVWICALVAMAASFIGLHLLAKKQFNNH